MEFTDQKWPSDKSVFPERELVQKYLEDYSMGVDRIKYNTEVTDLHGLTTHSMHEGKKWKVTTRNLKKNSTLKDEPPETYDAVVVATGTFDRVFQPEYPGLDDWKEKYPDTVLHSRSYRYAEDFRGEVCFP
jgi:cation diffusion facilitator CzcD-associated flavoprotein CzcO